MYFGEYSSNRNRFNNQKSIPYPQASSKITYKQDISRATEQPSYKIETPSPQPSKRFTYPRREISQTISMISTKKNKNKEAISEVKSANHQIASSLINSIKISRYEYQNNDYSKQREDSSRIFAVKSQFQWHPIQDMKNYQGDGVARQNINLRSQLNSQIQRNIQLIKYVQKLQAQNKALKSYPNNTKNASYLMEENRYLKAQIHAKSSSNLQLNQLKTELNRLKSESQCLRKETCALLEKKR